MNPKTYGSFAWRRAMPIARFILYLTRCHPRTRPFVPHRLSLWCCGVAWAFYDQQWVKDDWRENHQPAFEQWMEEYHATAEATTTETL